MGRNVTKKALVEQARAVFGKGVIVYVHEPNRRVMLSFEAKRGESLETVKRWLYERLDELPCEEG